MGDSDTAFAISAPSIFDGERFVHDHCVIVRQQAVTQLLPAGECPPELPVVSLAGGTLAPGFVDLQVNGGGDLLFNNAPTANNSNWRSPPYAMPVPTAWQAYSAFTWRARSLPPSGVARTMRTWSGRRGTAISTGCAACRMCR